MPDHKINKSSEISSAVNKTTEDFKMCVLFLKILIFCSQVLIIKPALYLNVYLKRNFNMEVSSRKLI